MKPYNAMKILKHLHLIILFIFFAMLFLSNPSESTYLSRVSEDYAQYHQNMDISIEMLEHIGESNRTSYLLFSTYDYKFGNIRVFYIGIANSIYYLGTKTKKRDRTPIKVV
jgi:hypothetical protein